MEEPFPISINCSDVLPNNNNTQYKMFIDQTKMTMVYELIEWIRWIFSVKECFHLTYENSIIHELEDVKVLAKLSNFKLKLCGQTHCAHTKLYRTLLKSISFYVDWKGIKVPKYFLEKVNNMELKLDIKNQVDASKVTLKAKINPNDANCSCSENNYFLNNSDESVQKSWQNIHESSEKKIESGVSVSDDAGDLNPNLNSPEIKSLESINANTKCDNLSPLIKKNFNSIEEGKSESSVKSNKSKAHKNLKPFSIGELLSSIREECSQQTNGGEYVKDKSCETSDNENSSQIYLSSIEKDFYSSNFSFENSIKRKRKRTRRGGKKVKQKQLEFDQNLAPEQIVTPKYDSYFKKSNKEASHIRFDNESEEEDLNEKEGSVKKTEFTKENMEFANDKKNSVEEIFAMINNKKQILASLKELSSASRADDCSFQKEQNVINEKVEKMNNLGNIHNNEICNLNTDANALVQLKEKYPSPVIIERFY